MDGGFGGGLDGATKGLPCTNSSLTNQANFDLEHIIDETDANLRSIILSKQRKLAESKRPVQGRQKLPFIWN